MAAPIAFWFYLAVYFFYDLIGFGGGYPQEDRFTPLERGGYNGPAKKIPLASACSSTVALA